MGPSFSISTFAGWRLIPSTFVRCSRANSLFGQVGMPLLDAARASSPCAFDTVEEIDAGHMPMVSRPERVADILRRAALASK